MYLGGEPLRMIFLLFAVGAAAAIFIGSLILMNVGRQVGARRLAEEGASAMNGLSAVESAVFALMGQRFDERRALILQEANAISTAYDRIDLLNVDVRPQVKAKLKSYLENRLDLYRMPIEYSVEKAAALYSSEQLAKIRVLKGDVWNDAVTSCRMTVDTSACSLLLTALNNAFEAARLRSGANERHPPQIMYVMLFGLGLAGSLLAGVGMGASSKRSWVHMVTFAAAMSVALYIITDIEFPRLGLIRVDYFDHVLAEVLEQMR
jgi:hypothetical protein